MLRALFRRSRSDPEGGRRLAAPSRHLRIDAALSAGHARHRGHTDAGCPANFVQRLIGLLLFCQTAIEAYSFLVCKKVFSNYQQIVLTIPELYVTSLSSDKVWRRRRQLRASGNFRIAASMGATVMRLLRLTFFALFSVSGVWAQTASLTGVVKDSTGAVIAVGGYHRDPDRAQPDFSNQHRWRRPLRSAGPSGGPLFGGGPRHRV